MRATIRGPIQYQWCVTCPSDSKFLGPAVEALTDYEFQLAEVVTYVSERPNCDHDGVPPQRRVFSEPPEPDGHLAEDVDEEVVVIAFRHGDNLQDNFVAERVERLNSGF